MNQATINLVEVYLDGEQEAFIPFAHKNAIGCTIDYAAGFGQCKGKR